MAGLTFQALYNNRCEELKNESGETYFKPYFWKPTEVPKRELTVQDSGVPESISRILAGALAFEVDVQEYTHEVFRQVDKGDFGKVSNTVKKLLLSNVADESVHAQQIERAISAYPIANSDTQEASAISEAFKQAEGHPLQKAAILEIGVFVPCSLAILLRCGGNSLARVSRFIAQDEQRHVSTNLGLLAKFGFNPFEQTKSLDSLRKQTIDWLAKGLNIKQWGIDDNWIQKQSDLMVTTGRSQALDAWTSAYQDDMPFEINNKFLVY